MALLIPRIAVLACLVVFVVATRTRSRSQLTASVSYLQTHALRMLQMVGVILSFVIFPGAKLWLNESPIDERALRSTLQQFLSTRSEQLIWLAADERVSYGEVMSIILKLKQDNPEAYVALATKSQVGPVDPADREFRMAQMNPKLGIYSLCVRIGR